MNHVTTSAVCAVVGVVMGTLVRAVITLVMKVFTAETASKFVPLIVRYVDARTDCAPVRQDGPVQDVLKNASNSSGRTVSIHVMQTASTGYVTKLTEHAYLVV